MGHCCQPQAQHRVFTQRKPRVMHEEVVGKYEEPCRADECLDIPEVESKWHGESPTKDEEEHEELVEELLEEAKHEF